MNEPRILLALVLFSVALLGCSSDSSGLANGTVSPAGIIEVDPDDSELNAAKEKARATIDQFFRIRKKQGDAFDGLLKVYFVDDDVDDGEHMWVSVSESEGDQHKGTLLSRPAWLKNVSMGDSVEFETSDVSDWLAVEDGVAVGAYTVKLLRSRMSDEERASHDSGYPYSFD